MKWVSPRFNLVHAESALGSSYRQLVRARFTRSFLAQLIGLRVHYKHFEQDDPDLYLQKIKYILDSDLDKNENLEIYFVEEVYDQLGQLVKTIDLIPNGSKIRVRNSNKNQYLDALATHRLSNNVKEEIDSFLKGLNFIIPDNLLSIFDENELEVSSVTYGVYCRFISSFIVSSCFCVELENTQLLTLKLITSSMVGVQNFVEF